MMDRETFVHLLELHRAQPWLIPREAAFQNLRALCPTPESLSLLVSLLHRFRFLAIDEALSLTSKAAKQAAESWSLSPDDCIFTCLSDPEKASSGQVILTWCKNALATAGDWTKDNFSPSLPVAAHTIGEGGTIVFVDDFVGSGKSLETKTRYLRDTLRKRGVTRVRTLVVALVAMEAARISLDALVDGYLVLEFYRRGISDHYVGQTLVDAVRQMETLESLLSRKDGKRRLPPFGFRRSEALYAIDATSTPNNVFPVFWWRRLANGDYRPTLLTRA